MSGQRRRMVMTMNSGTLEYCDDNESIIATDTSSSAGDVSLVCVECDPDASGSPIYAGDEWGSCTGSRGQCGVCGHVPDGLVVV